MKGKTIKNYPAYTITEDGEVWSSCRKKPFTLKPQGATQNKRYLQVRLFNHERTPKGIKKGVLHYIHRLVYETYVGEVPKGKTIDHIDNNPFNNHYTNLQIMTQSDNSSKANSSKRKLVGLRDIILDLKNQGWNNTMLAEHFDCSYTHIWRIVNNKRMAKRNGKWIFVPLYK